MSGPTTTTIDGLKVEILKGQVNYGRWHRDLKAAATVKGVWELLEGTVGIHNKPERPTKPELKTRGSRDDTAAAAQRELFKEAVDNYSLSVTEYKLEMSEYEDNMKLVQTARGLLAATVDPSIRAVVQSKDSPKDALEQITSLCKMQDSRALDIAITGLERLKLSDCNSLTDYFNKAQAFRQDILDLKNPYTEDQLKSKILRGLTPPYNTIVDHLQIMQDNPSMPTADLKTTFSMLLAHESKVKERRPKTLKGKEQEGDQNGNSKGPRPKCTYAPCKKWGHLEPDCRLKKQHEESGNSKDKDTQKDPKAPSKPSKSGNSPDRRQIAAMVGGPGMAHFHQLIDESFEDNTKGFREALVKTDMKDSFQQAKPDESPLVAFGEMSLYKEPISISAAPDRFLNQLRGMETQIDHTNNSAGMSQIHLPETNTDPSSQFYEDREGLDQGGEGKGVHGRDCESVSPMSLVPEYQANSSNHAIAMLSGCDISQKQWIADTAATTHIVNDRQLFSKFKAVDMTIGTADKDTNLDIKGAGTAHITMLPGSNDPVDFSLTQAAYAPSSICNLLSLPMLATKANLHGTWDKDGLTFLTQEGDLVGKAIMKDGLYHVQITHQSEATCQSDLAAAVTDFDDEVWKWHRRLGHLSWESMRKLLKQSIGMTITDKQIAAKVKTICPVCATTRALVKIPRDPARRRYKKVGQLLIVDTWGPYPIEGQNGIKYALFVTDDGLRYTWVDLFSTKDQIPSLLKARCRKIKKVHDCDILRIRFDNEFDNAEIRQWTLEQGTEMEPSAPYAHHQVGTDERVHRTVREKASAMIQEQTMTGQITKIVTERTTEILRSTTMPEFLWPEALKHAAWLKNRSPTKAHKNKKTPFEALHGMPPDLTRERIWGSRAYVSVPTDVRGSKLHTPRGWLGYFVGCESEHIYRIWHPDEKVVKRISAARIDDIEGPDDTHEQPSMTDRAPHDQSSGSISTDPLDSDQESSASVDEASEDSADESSSANGTENDEVDSDSAGDMNNLPHNDNEQSDESEDETGPTVSKYFGNPGLVALARKRGRDEIDEDIDEEIETLRKDSDNDDDDDWETDDDGDSEQISAPPPKYFGNRRYEGDCDSCARKTRTCDGNRPCSTCIVLHTEKTCKDPTEYTKKHIPLKQRSLKQGELQPPHLKCRNCYRQGIGCYKTDPDGPCTGCAKRGYCTPQSADGTRLKKKEDFPLNREDRCARCFKKKRLCSITRPCSYCQKDQVECTPRVPPKKGVPLAQKCKPCERRNRRCDGNIPCQTCIEKKSRCEPQGNLPPCWTCGTTHHCDRNKPCGGCVRRGKKYCQWMSDDHMIATCHPVNSDTGKEEDDEECRKCRDHSRNCNNGEPCYRCVRHRRPVCSYLRKGGIVQRFRAYPYYVINSEQRVVRDESQIAHKGEFTSEHERALKRAAYQRRKDRATAGDNPADELSEASISDSEDDLDEDLENPSPKEDSLAAVALFTSKNLAEICDDTDISSEDESDLDEDLSASRREIRKGYAAMTVQVCSSLSEPKNYQQALAQPDGRQFQEAVELEMQSLITNNVFELVDLPRDRKAISTKWVFKRKVDAQNKITRHKARLVARGFQQRSGVDFHETYSGVVKPTSYRILFALSAIFGWISHQMDVKTAFLNAELEEEIYVRPPPPYSLPRGKAWRMTRALYGFKQSPRAWYNKLSAELNRLNFRASAYDHCVFVHESEQLIIVIHVDDIRLFSPSQATIDNFKRRITSVFQMTDEGLGEVYLGMQVEQSTQGVYLHQTAYIEKILDRFDLNKAVSVRTPCDPEKKLWMDIENIATDEFKHRYLSMFGSLNYLPTITRPDLAYAVSMIGRYNSNPNQEHLDASLRIYAYLIGTKNHGLFFTKDDPELKAYVDSDYGGCLDTARSTTGWIFTMAGGPVSWGAKRQQTVSLSSTEAEYMAATEAAKEAVWIKSFVNDLGIPNYQIGPVQLQVDNASAIKLTKNPELHQRTKHIAIRHHFIRECVEDGHIQISWIKGTENLADALTKALGRSKFEDFINAARLDQGYGSIR